MECGKNTQKEIIISNDYMGGVKFSIKIVEKDIKIGDCTFRPWGDKHHYQLKT